MYALKNVVHITCQLSNPSMHAPITTRSPDQSWNSWLESVISTRIVAYRSSIIGWLGYTRTDTPRDRSTTYDSDACITCGCGGAHVSPSSSTCASPIKRRLRIYATLSGRLSTRVDRPLSNLWLRSLPLSLASTPVPLHVVIPET
jgi:hypothetical protein